ncbi:TRAP transporter large permease subunit [Natronorubrum sp. FCH18a]|uniref:TRAP transporter large permease subunit n=1 Tax=Natronorubrum sp. FCH18a TaxID=3447018 RepID=UPI003F517B9A
MRPKISWICHFLRREYVALEIGLNPVIWGVIFILGDAIGFITPPYGLNLYIISGLTDIDYMVVAYRVLPYLGGLLALLFVLLAVPEVNVLA